MQDEMVMALALIALAQVSCNRLAFWSHRVDHRVGTAGFGRDSELHGEYLPACLCFTACFGFSEVLLIVCVLFGC